LGSIAIQAEQLGKRYRIGVAARRPRTLREAITLAASAPIRNLRTLRLRPAAGMDDRADLLWALREVSFEVREGEVVGIIGRNGAGKSTLLKVLTRITEPTLGHADLWGRVGSLLEVGIGFHPELTGRDNVHLSAAVLGMDRAYVRRRFDEIVEFGGIERFIDTPVKYYSSGMYVRLAFAVAAHLESEILIVDEVLAVGDAEFQRKCLTKMDALAHGGRTVLFVSHNLPSIQRLCPRSIMLEGGCLVADGSTSNVVDRYLASGADDAPPGHWIDLANATRTGAGGARFTSIRYTSRDRQLALHPFTGGPLEVALKVASDAPRHVSLAVSISNQSGTKLVNADTTTLGRLVALSQDENTWRFTIERLHLKPGVYVVGVWIGDRKAETLDWIESAFRIRVGDPCPDRPTVRLDPRYDGPVACPFDVAEMSQELLDAE
jgi:lipopolysaccharide transport system ATP-binding protein